MALKAKRGYKYIILLLIAVGITFYYIINARPKKTVIFTISQEAGFASVFAFLLESYIYAKKHGYDFIIKNENWHYGNENGWHTYFNSLERYNPSKIYKGEENYRHHNTPKGNYTIEEYHHAINNIYKPNDLIINKAKEFIQSIGGKYDAIYVRRGDKVSGAKKEMDAISVTDICKAIKFDNRNLFIMTDDYTVVQEFIEKLPKSKIFTMTSPESKGSHEKQLQNAEPHVKVKQGEKLFTEIEVFHNAEKGWVDVRSNIGRFLKMRDLNKIHLYPSDIQIPLNKVVHPYNEI
jgi:hypothetical protein